MMNGRMIIRPYVQTQLPKNVLPGYMPRQYDNKRIKKLRQYPIADFASPASPF